MDANDAIQAREKYVSSFNKTMIDIWQEQITLLNVIDTGRLLNSFVNIPVTADGKFIEVTLSQSFLEYGIWVDYGTGKEVPRGNSGDIGRTRRRQRKQWFSQKYYASVMNLKDFLAESIGEEFVGVVTNALNDKLRESIRLRDNHRAYANMMGNP